MKGNTIRFIWTGVGGSVGIAAAAVEVPEGSSNACLLHGFKTVCRLLLFCLIMFNNLFCYYQMFIWSISHCNWEIQVAIKTY